MHRFTIHVRIIHLQYMSGSYIYNTCQDNTFYIKDSAGVVLKISASLS